MGRALRYEEAVARLKAGSRLAVALPSPLMSGDRPAYEVMPDGGHVTIYTFNRLKPDLEPLDAALFDEVPPQSYRWRGGG